MLTSIEFVLFSIFSATQKCTKKSKLTKELSENTCEEVQVTGNIVGHGRRKRFHNGVNAEYSLKKLHTQKKYYILNCITNGIICKIIQSRQMGKIRVKILLRKQENKDIMLYNPKK
jgi:hypothetical protein